MRPVVPTMHVYSFRGTQAARLSIANSLCLQASNAANQQGEEGITNATGRENHRDRKGGECKLRQELEQEKTISSQPTAWDWMNSSLTPTCPASFPSDDNPSLPPLRLFLHFAMPVLSREIFHVYRWLWPELNYSSY